MCGMKIVVVKCLDDGYIDILTASYDTARLVWLHNDGSPANTIRARGQRAWIPVKSLRRERLQ